MEKNLFEKIGMILKTSISSALNIEIILIFLLLFLFLIFNLKYRRKTVIFFLTTLLCYFLIAFIIAFHEEFFLAVRAFVKKIVEYFYFSPIPVYYFTLFIIECGNASIHINEITEIYQNELTLSYIQVSQLFFFLYLGSCLTRYIYRSYKDKIVK